jgi:antitoxin VapB
MSTRNPAFSASAQVTMTTVFTSGNSQAVRLPKEFRFSSKQVSIEKRGDEIVLRERKPTLGELLKSLPVLTQDEAADMARIVEQARDQPAQTRNWDELFGFEKSKDKKLAPASKPSTKRRIAPRK